MTHTSIAFSERCPEDGKMLLSRQIVALCVSFSALASACGDGQGTSSGAGAASSSGGAAAGGAGSGGEGGAAGTGASGGTGAAASCPPVSTFDPMTASEILVNGDMPAMGIFDASLVYPGDAPAGAMAYSAVPNQESIRTHIAVSLDKGVTWSLLAEANTPETQTIASSDANECPGGSCSGNLISEVPTLIFDADEPDPAKVWKLFAHRYLVAPNVALHYRIGTIALQTAPAAEGPWSAPQKLIGWASPSDYSSTGVATNVSSIDAMKDCVLLTEPGALWLPGRIDLAVGCAYLDGAGFSIRVELLRSKDHGASWAHVSTLVRPADALDCTPGATAFNAASLFASGGVEYLSVTPGVKNGLYEGCYIYPFTDPDAGTLARDAKGRAIAARAIAAANMQFSGACAFADGAMGYALDVGFLDPSTQRKFRLFRPGLSTP